MLLASPGSLSPASLRYFHFGCRGELITPGQIGAPFQPIGFGFVDDIELGVVLGGRAGDVGRGEGGAAGGNGLQGVGVEPKAAQAKLQVDAADAPELRVVANQIAVVGFDVGLGEDGAGVRGELDFQDSADSHASKGDRAPDCSPNRSSPFSVTNKPAGSRSVTGASASPSN